MGSVGEHMSDGTVWLVVNRAIAAHDRRADGSAGRCPHCPREGACEELAWAREERARLERATAARLAAWRLGEPPTPDPAGYPQARGGG